MTQRARAALAGAAAATVWGLLVPLDRRLFRCDYSDIALLGKAVTRGRGWWPLGFALHAINGAVFGLAFDAVRTRTGAPKRPPGADKLQLLVKPKGGPQRAWTGWENAISALKWIDEHGLKPTATASLTLNGQRYDTPAKVTAQAKQLVAKYLA